MGADMKEVVAVQRTVVTIDGRTRIREIQYQGQIDSMGRCHLLRCVGKFISPQRPQAAAPVRKNAA